MRNLLIAVVAAVAVVAGLSVVASADRGQQGTSWTFSFSDKRPAKATGSNSIIEPAKHNDNGTPDDESDDTYAAPAVSTIRFPRGSSIDTGALARCKHSPSDVQRGTKKCPSRTKVGSGLATSLLGQPNAGEGSGQEVVAPIEAFNQKKGILFVVRPCQPGTGPTKPAACNPIPGGTIVLVGGWSKVTRQPTLRVPTPDVLKGRVIITRFQLKTAKKTRKTTVRIDGRRRTVIRSYASTPGRCKGKWKSAAIEKYEDGSSQTIPDAMTCRRG